jgi:hypothetical protein
MEAPLILADHIMRIVRGSGLNKSQARVALHIAEELLTATDDLPIAPVQIPAFQESEAL